MALRTRAAVPGLTLAELLIVRETVAVETLARFATSLIFIRIHKEKSLEGKLNSSNDCQAKELCPTYHDRRWGKRRATYVSVYSEDSIGDNARFHPHDRVKDQPRIAMHRRDFLKTTSTLIAGATLSRSAFAGSANQAAPADGRLMLPMNRNWRYSRTVAEGAHVREFDDSG